ncbi:ARM repeat-containing protein [Saitoella complicata NRRL Y-17804]|uniref:ARM repeat-containing protein n=1 Tax=Saitoella complicata (strain BCRC 22490 / CBS 7301 / JCM 7358 / NBRC 10748 / NRRL Y-17804) TaxID=698492 RepID=UPI0008671F4B|nr:ARM repeat-containing protein [Saitoella complicata NRRL Y-17804]ODQ53263.1 ARM repeat-containing protein [Saitoella complicata NRRL Y-17804]
MADDEVNSSLNGKPDFDWEDFGRDLRRSQPAVRIAAITHKLIPFIKSEDFTAQDLVLSLKSLFGTYPSYVDKGSRSAVTRAFAALNERNSAVFFTKIIPAIKKESAKASTGAIAASNAFALLEWINDLIVLASTSEEAFSKVSGDAIIAQATLLEACMSYESKEGIRKGALQSTRAAMRALFRLPEGRGAQIVQQYVETLVAGGNPTNAVALGVVAGVASHLTVTSAPKEKVEELNGQYYTYFTKVLLASKTHVPRHIAEGLGDFFKGFTTSEDFVGQLATPLKNSLLRAPDMVLNSLAGPVFTSLRESIDPSEALNTALLTPILNGLKSSNTSTREGALKTLQAVLPLCKNEEGAAKVAASIAENLKPGKLASAEHRTTYARSLSFLPPSISLAKTVPSSLLAGIAKEANEQALVAEVKAAMGCVSWGLKNGVAVENDVAAAVVKGFADKKGAVKSVWLSTTAAALWDAGVSPSAEVLEFARAVAKPLLDAGRAASADALKAVQDGGVVAAYAGTAVGLGRFAQWKELEVDTAGIAAAALTLSPKPSYLLYDRVFTKLASPEDHTWFARALQTVAEHASEKQFKAAGAAWSQSMIYAITAPSVSHEVKAIAQESLKACYLARPALVSAEIASGVWSWLVQLDEARKEGPAASAGVQSLNNLHSVLISICPNTDAAVDQEILQQQMVDLAVVAHHPLLKVGKRNLWIELCLRVGVDPGVLVATRAEELVLTVEVVLSQNSPDNAARAAALRTVETLGFVTPDASLPLLIEAFKRDLQPESYRWIGVDEAGIWSTKEGSLFVDVLDKSKKEINKGNTKDYETAKWEAELRAQIAQKKTEKKLTKEEQILVNQQLAKEKEIRAKVQDVYVTVRRGLGIIKTLASSKIVGAAAWMGSAIESLLGPALQQVGLIVGDEAVLTYLECSEQATGRLGTTAKFVGVATLRAMGVPYIPAELREELLKDLATRVLFRLRFAGEQRPFDDVTLTYALPLIIATINNGGTGTTAQEEVEEQILLAVETITTHAENFKNASLPRQNVIDALLSILKNQPAHYNAAKACLAEICQGLAENISSAERDALLRGASSSEVSVRTAVLQALKPLDLTTIDFSEELWMACHDETEANAQIAIELWNENAMEVNEESPAALLKHVVSDNAYARRAAAFALAEASEHFPATVSETVTSLQTLYREKAKPLVPVYDEYGMIKPASLNQKDPWEARVGVALALKNLAPLFTAQDLRALVSFLVEDEALGDRHASVRQAMLEAGIAVISIHGKAQVEELLPQFEKYLSGSSANETQDLVRESCVILFGAAARHLESTDKRIPNVVTQLLETLKTPSEAVQTAVADCLPPLVKSIEKEVPKLIDSSLAQLFEGEKYAERRGAAYGLAGVVKGRGIAILRDSQLMSALREAFEDRKESKRRQGAVFAIETMSLILGKFFEPYVIQTLPSLLGTFGDSVADVREATQDAARVIMGRISGHCVKLILPSLLSGLDDTQWRSKKGCIEMLGAMAYCAPRQLSISLPTIVPRLTEVMTDSHAQVRNAANESLLRFGEVINNPEIQELVPLLLKALSDPNKYTDDALEKLLKTAFIHYIDAPSLALLMPILSRGMRERSATTKMKAAQIFGNMASLTDPKDLVPYLEQFLPLVKDVLVDPVPATRSTAAKALGTLVEKLGEHNFPSLLSDLFVILKSEHSGVDRQGAAQGLSEIFAGLGMDRLEAVLPEILIGTENTKSYVREGYMSLLVYLPATFGNRFQPYLGRTIPHILSGLADDSDYVREASLRAGRMIVNNYATKAVDLLLPELERGLFSENWRIRLSSVELLGDLLFKITGISGKTELDEGEEEEHIDHRKLLSEILGQERRDRVLAALYIIRQDSSGMVRSASVAVWKSLVSNTPKVVKDIMPVMTSIIIRNLASSAYERKKVSASTLGDIVRKLGDSVLAQLLPVLLETLENGDGETKQGVCVALCEIMESTSAETLEDHEDLLIAAVRSSIVDHDADVREHAARAFSLLQQILGSKAVDQILPSLLSLLQSGENSQNALAALRDLMELRSNVIFPVLIPTLISVPISAFNARALASLAEVAGASLTKRLTAIINALVDSLVLEKDEDVVAELNSAFDTVILAIDGAEGINTLMALMLGLIKNEIAAKRALACNHMTRFFAETEADYSRYVQDWIRVLLVLFNDRDQGVVKAANEALAALTKAVKKEDMEALVVPARRSIQAVGYAGADLPGFCLPKGINAILPIFLQGLMFGNIDQREQSALAMADIVQRTSADALKPFITQITGLMIRSMSEKLPGAVRAAILHTLNVLLDKVPALLKPFLPQLQRTFAKCLADVDSEVVRTRAAQALGTLITLQTRVDPLIAELVAGARTPDEGVRLAMLKAIYQVVSKAGTGMSEVSKKAVMALVEEGLQDPSQKTSMLCAKLYGATVKIFSPEEAAGSIRNQLSGVGLTRPSTLCLNSLLLESPAAVTASGMVGEVADIIARGIKSTDAVVSENSVLAAGKYLLQEEIPKEAEQIESMLDTLAAAVTDSASGSTDSQRLSLVTITTLARKHYEMVEPHVQKLAPVMFSQLRTMVIPVKLAAEQAWIALFRMVADGEEHIDKYIATLQGTDARRIGDYSKRVASKLAAAERERIEAGGDRAPEQEDLEEIMSVGGVQGAQHFDD